MSAVLEHVCQQCYERNATHYMPEETAEWRPLADNDPYNGPTYVCHECFVARAWRK